MRKFFTIFAAFLSCCCLSLGLAACKDDEKTDSSLEESTSVTESASGASVEDSTSTESVAGSDSTSVADSVSTVAPDSSVVVPDSSVVVSDSSVVVPDSSVVVPDSSVVVPDSSVVVPDSSVVVPDSSVVVPDSSVVVPDSSVVVPDSSVAVPDSSVVVPDSSVVVPDSSVVVPDSSVVVPDSSTPPDSSSSGTQTPSNVPSYLGILASDAAPSQANGLPTQIAPRNALARSVRGDSGYKSFEERLEEYYQGETLPTETNYPLYSRAGNTVYVQIWLNNPAQYTILSLKLNGLKYQIGGNLFSFFLSEGGVVYNCLYAAVTIPNNAYESIEYTVSEIEYVANTYINADGTDEFMNDNDTVEIGLPYQESLPTVAKDFSDYGQVSTYKLNFTVTDSENLVEKSGGWLRAVVIDNNNEICAHEEVTVGQNEISASGLKDDSFYQVIVFLYADLRDGHGVIPHAVYADYTHTASAIALDSAEYTVVYSESEDKFIPKITVKTNLDASATYTRLELVKTWYKLESVEEVVYTTTEYNGSAELTENILNKTGYEVRVYYQNAAGEEKCFTHYDYVAELGGANLCDEELYSFYDDGALRFRLSNSETYPYVQDFTMKVYDKSSAAYIAADVLYLKENPTAIADLEEQADGLDHRDPEQYAQYEILRARIDELNDVKNALEYDFADRAEDTAFWQAEAAKGRYLYELAFTRDGNSDIEKIGDTYYALLDNLYQAATSNSVYFSVIANIDKNEGEGVEEYKFYEQNIRLDHDLAGDAYWSAQVQNLNLTGETVSFDLVNSNGDFPNVRQGYVYKIFLVKNGNYGNAVTVYENLNPTLSLDEGAWQEEYFAKLAAGESVDGLTAKYVGSYEEGSIEVELTSLDIAGGEWELVVYTRLYKERYAEEGHYDSRASTTYLHVGTYKTPQISFGDSGYGSAQARFSVEDGEYYDIYINVKDAEGNPVVTNEYCSEYYVGMQTGYKIQAQARPKEYAQSYWKQSEWSAWVTFEGFTLETPVLSYDKDTCSVTWEEVWNAYGYEYILNGGTATRSDGRSIAVVNGDVVKVRALAPATGSAYCDGNWSAEFTVVETREQLAAPTNVRSEGYNRLCWDSVANATKYIVRSDRGLERETTDLFVEEYLEYGATYFVYAVDETGAYRMSLAGTFTYTGKAEW